MPPLKSVSTGPGATTLTAIPRGPEELGDGGRVRWVSGRPVRRPAYAGTDFIIARDGRIAAV